VSLKTKIVNGRGIPWNIDSEGNGVVTVATHPPIGEGVIGLPFRRYFRNSAGSNDMTVNGSPAAPIEFTIEGDPNYDTWIKSLNVRIGDAGAQFNDFGAINGGLTNGVEIVWRSQEIGEYTLHDGIQDNLEWFRFGGQTPTIIDLTGGGSDAIVAQIDLYAVFAPPFGLRLKAGSAEQLVMKVRDNLTTVDEFDVIAYGVNIVPQ
jgi:hypothetical protein